MHTQRINSLDIDQQKLSAELAVLDGLKYQHAYSDFLCGGPWKSVMLWSAGGEQGDGFITHYDKAMAGAKTAALRMMPYLDEIIERTFHLDRLKFARIGVLPPGSVIIPHRDLLEVDAPLHRVHVPLITDERCFFSHGNVVYHMKFGEAWFFDAAVEHCAASFSDKDRVHLILDFEDVASVDEIVKISREGHQGFPPESVDRRAPLSDEEKAALDGMACVLDGDNYKDILAVIVKKHFYRDGGSNFIWNTFNGIARKSSDRAAVAKIDSMHEYFMIARSD